ncbi:hypothetical protein F3Y22_tig00002799pilonHSYRG00201 [Hibiscus syriacus]|uniref:LRAT domain-containing protein n=1 Tax=Hibiscus syriacus TaxID=106335 RepID=A0A6A3CPX4_HIBSY|nr:hypothetical protein F3Y22_tig00002799pilonHSYRG00201 [Hibiscus syriacus]
MFSIESSGIYVGDNMVIHLAGKAKKIQPYTCKECINKGVINGEIAKICIYCFLAGKKLKVYEYGVSYFKHKFKKNGTCCIRAARPPHEVLASAAHLLEHGGFGSYNLLSNNCEDFAVHCKTGFAESKQIMGHIKRLTFIFPVVGAIATVPLAAAYAVSKGITASKRHHSLT